MQHQFEPVETRDPSMKDTDKSALYAIAQAAVNVELFTIPLYMTSLYSLQGTHQITGQNSFYKGRLWPGMSTSADPQKGNQKAFNAIFSVFIAEMLHLQLASNICKSIGVKPSYTSPAMQNEQYGWTCYGPEQTVIPHILDLKDTSIYSNLKVNIGPVNATQLDLFLAIEETEERAEDIITDKSKYFPQVPFQNWTVNSQEQDLPLFGSIGYMYLSLFRYLGITYTDGTTLWDYVFTANSIQRDLFNTQSADHDPEYPGMSATITAQEQDKALMHVIDMIQGITDQGEGKGVIPELRRVAVKLLKNTAKANMLTNNVQQNFQPSAAALEKDYPTYDENGNKMPKSRDAAARIEYGKIDHYETFEKVQEMLNNNELETWDQWHAKGNVWTADLLQTPENETNQYPIPPAQDIADALNRLKENDTDKNFEMISRVVAGAIKGVTTVLDKYWNDTSSSTFPFPSMVGSGDRMSICWAIFGKAPDLSLGVEAKTPGVLYHACQGMNLDAGNQGEDPNNCAATAVFHACRGSNTCAAEGGCGFVQNVNGGGSGCGSSGSSCGQSGAPQACGSKAKMVSLTAGCGHPGANSGSNTQPKDKNLCGGPTPPTPGQQYYSAPSDNRCMSYGGCAVPISASQLFPAPPDNAQATSGQMKLYNFVGSDFEPQQFKTMSYNVGSPVYDVAWEAYIEVLQERQQPVPDKPKPSDIRLAFPPST